MAQLDPEDYAVGRVVKHGDNHLSVRDTLQTASGGRYLLVGPLDSPFCALLPEADVRDNPDDRYEAVDPDDAQELRERAAEQGTDTGTPPGATGTGGTDGTADQESPAEPATEPPPGPAAATPPTPGGQ
jgi:hypothetical protein